VSLSIGAPAPAFSLPAVGGTASLEDLADKSAVVVAFSCNHCPYVMAWEDRMNDIARDYADKGVAMVAINANNEVTHPADSFGKMVERADEKGFVFAYARDESQEVARAYAAERTPEFYVLDGERNVAYHGALDDNTEPDLATESFLRDALDAVLEGKIPATIETPAVGCTIKWKK
jgi:peroxiredoxin